MNMTIGVILITALVNLINSLHFGLKSYHTKTHAILFTQSWLNYDLYKETEEFYKVEDALMHCLGVPFYHIFGILGVAF